MVCVLFCTSFSFYISPIWKYVFYCSVISHFFVFVYVDIKGGCLGAQPPEATAVLLIKGTRRLIPQRKFLIYLRTKSSAQHDFIDPLRSVQGQWHPEGDKGKGIEAKYCNKLQILWSSCYT